MSGIWAKDPADPRRFLNGQTGLIGAGVEVAPTHPWAAALWKEPRDNFLKDKPGGRCLPHGVPDAMLMGPDSPFKIIQTPRVTVVLIEEFSVFRQIHTDGRTLPVDPNPTYFGYSIGKWEGDTLVVETAGFNDASWLDNSGLPHSDALRVTERFRRPDFGTIEMEVTFDDSKAYTKPWKFTARLKLVPDTELLEHLCENEKDAPNLVGK